MAEDNLQYDTEQPEIQVDDHLEQEQQGPGDPPSKVLWEKMVKNKRYSFSYDDFQKEYNSKESIAKLHKELRGVGAKVVPINDFYAKYFPDLAGAKSSTTKPAQNEKPTAAGAQQQPVTSQTPKLAPQVFEKPITSQQYAPMDGIPAYGSPEYKKIKAAEAEKQSKQVAQQRAFQEFETAYDKFNIAKKNVDNGNDPDEQGVLSNGKPYSKAIGGKGVIENVSDFIIGHIVPSEAVKQEQERSRMQSKLLSYSSANEKALKTAQVYIDDITNEALKGYTRLSKISSVDGVHTPDPIKIRQYINNRAESAGFSKDGPVYDILNSKITAGVEYAIKKPTIEKNANEISKKETGKSIQELVSAEQQAIIQSAADINSKAKLQAETLAQKTISANKAEAQDLFNTKYKPLYDERNAISEQAASAFEKQFAHLIKDGKFIGSPQEYEMYNQQLAALQAIDDENKALTDSWSKELFKEQGRIASKYNKQYMAGISALEASTKKELAKKNEELKAFKVSPGLLTKINRYYEEAYKKTVTDEDAAKAPKGFLQTLSAFDSMFTHNFLDAMANYAGRMGLKGIESVFAAGANEFNPQQIEMNKFSDFLSPYKVIGSAATMGGRMGPAIAAGAITGAVTKNTGMAFRAFMAGANEWLTENTDNAHSTYKDVLAETGDPAKAENAAQKQYEAGMINLPLYGLGWMPFFSKSFNKLPLVAKIVAGTAIETGTELPTEFSQNLQEESIKKTGDWKNMLDYATWEKAKYTFYNIVPLSLVMGGGGHVVTHFADKVTYNQKVDALVQAAEIGGASASQQDQYAFNLVKIGDTKLAKAVLVGLHQSGRITDKELNRLNATVDKAKSITESAEKLGMNEGEQRIYAALNYQFEEAKANMATEKDPIAREAWKLKAANAQQNITNFAATKQGDYAIVTYADGGQSVFSHEEINNALSNPAVANSLAKGTLKIEVFGKEKEALAEKIKQATEVKKKSTASTSVVDEETESGNGDFSVEKVDAADGITQYLPTSSISGYFKDEQGEDISFTTEQEAKDFLSKQPKAQVPAMSTQSKKETLTKEQDEAKQRVATFIDNTVSLPTTDATLRERLENDPKAALQELIDFHEQQKSGKDEKTQVFHQKAIDKFEALKNDIDLINQQPQKSAETQKHDGSKSKDVESAIDGGKSQQPGQPQQNEVEIPNTPEASQLDEERKKAIAPLQAVAGGKATHTIQLPQRGKNTATILQNGREAGSIILTPEEQSLNDQKEAGREAGLVTDEEYNEWHKGFTAKVAARAIDATNKQYAKKQEALVNNPPSFLQRVKNLDLEAITDPIGRVLKYFALGGKINTNFVKEQYGGKDERIRQSTSTEEQRRSMFSLLAKDAPNIEKLAEQLESEANHHNDGNSRLDTRDYVRAIEEVLSSHQSPASAAKELWEKYSPEATEAEIAKLWEQKGGSQTQEESAPMEETEVLQPLTINGEEISFSADNSNPQTASQEPKLLTPNDPKFKRLQKAINRFLSKIKGYSTEVLHGQDFQKLVDWAKRQQDVSKEEGGGVDVETKQQIENFGVNKADVEPVHNVISQVFNGLKKAGLTAAKTVGDWVGIGKGSEKPYSLKIDGKDVKVKPTSSDVVNGFYSPLEKVVTDSKFDKLPAKQWIEKYANSEEAKWTGLKDWLAQQQGSVSKADIQKYLKDNRIQVVEVVKGEVSNFTKDDIADVKINQHGAGNWVVKTKEDGTVEFPLDKADDKAEAIEYALEQLNYDNKSKRESKPKFQQYQLEGQKENYKEVLVTMPSRTPNYTPITELPSGYDITFDSRNNTYAVIEENQTSGKSITGRYHNTKEDAVKNAIEVINAQRKNVITGKAFDNQFKSSHFDEPNILVHLRMNTRTDSEGNKVLFLEEVQSDFGQSYKKDMDRIMDLYSKDETLQAEVKLMIKSSDSFNKLLGSVRGKPDEFYKHLGL